MPRLTTAIIGLAIVLAGSVAAQDRATFNVGTATAARGQRATGVIAVPGGSDGGLNFRSRFSMARSPDRYWHGLGAHGTEYASIIALEKLIV